MKQAPVKIEVEKIGYLSRDLSDEDKIVWFLPSGYKGRLLEVTEFKTNNPTVKYAEGKEWNVDF